MGDLGLGGLRLLRFRMFAFTIGESKDNDGLFFAWFATDKDIDDISIIVKGLGVNHGLADGVAKIAAKDVVVFLYGSKLSNCFTRSLGGGSSSGTGGGGAGCFSGHDLQ